MLSVAPEATLSPVPLKAWVEVTVRFPSWRVPAETETAPVMVLA